MKIDLNYAKQVIASEAAGVAQMAAIIDDTFSSAAELIYNCTGSVIVSGMGKAGIVGQKISSTLASTGTPSHFLHPAEAVHGDLGRLRQGDVVLVLSYGGETDEILRMVNIVKQFEIKIIAITGKKQSRLAKYSDIVLCMGELEEACPFGVAPSVSTTCMLAVGDALALVVMKAKEFGVEDYARFHPAGSLGAKLITVEQSMMIKADEKLPLAKVSDTVRQMLAANSTVKRHGAVMIVGLDGKLVGIITDADLRRHVAENGEKIFDVAVKDIMTANCKRIRAGALAAEAMAIFHKYRIDDLPVVDDDDKPVGMVDVQDVFAIKIVG
jgi:arabinose-5-phosphate isomerase